jgi:hypothetical protein
MQIKEFKIRCSAISDIMTNPRSKSDLLSQTCKTYLETWVKEQIYETKKEIKSKYLTKGIEVESQALEYYSDVNDLGFLVINQEHYENPFMTGTPDLIFKETVYDFKSSWDCFTFPLFENEVDKGYWMQLQGYMHLTGLKSAKLVYTLQNTPEELVYGEAKDYSEIDCKFRIKEFWFDYSPEFIVSVEARVIECREYVKGLVDAL